MDLNLDLEAIMQLMPADLLAAQTDLSRVVEALRVMNNPTDQDIDALREIREPCVCHLGHPPCGPCSDPVTVAEAYEVVDYIAAHPRVVKVKLPAFEDHPSFGSW